MPVLVRRRPGRAGDDGLPARDVGLGLAVTAGGRLCPVPRLGRPLAGAEPGMSASPAATPDDVAGVAWLSGVAELAAAAPGIAACPGAAAASPLVSAACERPWSACGVPGAAAVPAGSAELSDPLFTNPTTPSPDSGSGYWCALTEKFGSESPPIVCSTPWA